MAASVRREVKKGGYASVSEFFRELLRERKVLADVNQSRREIIDGKGKILKSLSDLD
jgi:Arc/MetJ-type ribon-helix-helix transcriptional regulator